MAVLCIQSWFILHHPGPLVASSIVVILDSVPLLSLSLSLSAYLSFSRSFSLGLFSLLYRTLPVCAASIFFFSFCPGYHGSRWLLDLSLSLSLFCSCCSRLSTLDFLLSLPNPARSFASSFQINLLFSSAGKEAQLYSLLVLDGYLVMTSMVQADLGPSALAKYKDGPIEDSVCSPGPIYHYLYKDGAGSNSIAAPSFGSSLAAASLS